MSDYYLELEKPIYEIEKRIKLIQKDIDADSSTEINKLRKEKEKMTKDIFSKLTRWERVQLARHPQRPFFMDYIDHFVDEKIELHGDRHFADDPAVICIIGKIDKIKAVFIGQQKGRNTKENIHRNFGMMRPEGYRKALRVMKLAEKFELPIVSLIDTPGAYPGIGAEERGQGEAIAKNIYEMSKLKVPIVSVVIGEGASGGALGIGVCDRMLMFENTWYSVISPEGCASILWRDASKAPEAADSMKVTAQDLVEMGICDKILKEPLGGAHRDPAEAASILKKAIIEEIAMLRKNDKISYLDSRIDRYYRMGAFDSED